MQVTETRSDGLKHELKVVLSSAEIEEKLEYRLQELGRTVTLPGFRPGRVPLQMLKTRFGKSVMGEIVQGAITDGSSQAMMERGLRPATQPKVEITSFEEGQDLEFKIELEVLPEIGPVDFSGIEVERLVIEVGENEVDSALEHLAEHNKEATPVTTGREAGTGDVLHIDFVGRIDGEEFPGGAAEAYRLELGSGAFIAGFEEQLLGAKAGETRDVKISFPEDYGNAALAGKDAVFEVKVKELLEPVTPMLDDDFAKKVGAPDLAALRADLRERIEAQYGEVARDRLKRRLFDALAERHSFEVPQGMLESEFQGIWQQVKGNMERGALPEEDQGKSEAELEEEYRAIAERRVRLGLLLSDIGEKNQITVGQEEVSRALVDEARKHPGHERDILERYQQDPQAMAALRAPVFENKVVDFVLDQVKTTERRLSVDELVAEAKAEQTPAGGEEGEEKAGGRKGQTGKSGGKGSKAKAKSGGRKAAARS